MNPKQFNILGTQYTISSFEALLESLASQCEEKRSGYTCVSAVHLCVEATLNPTIRQAVDNATYVTADGMPIVRALKLLYNVTQPRIPGMELLPRLLQRLDEKKLSVFFWAARTTFCRKPRAE